MPGKKWTYREDKIFDKSVLDMGWSNWKEIVASKRLPGRTKRAIVQYALNIKKNDTTRYERLIRLSPTEPRLIVNIDHPLVYFQQSSGAYTVQHLVQHLANRSKKVFGNYPSKSQAIVVANAVLEVLPQKDKSNVSDEDYKEACIVAKRAARAYEEAPENQQELVEARGQLNDEVTMCGKKKYYCASGGKDCGWNALVDHGGVFDCAKCALKNLDHKIYDGVNYYIDDDGEIQEGVGWCHRDGQLHPDWRLRVCEEKKGTVEAEVAIQHQLEILKKMAVRNAINYSDEETRKSILDYKKLLYSKKATLAKDGSIAFNENSDYTFDEPPPADEFVKSFLEPIIDEYGKTHVILLYAFKASCTTTVKDGTFVFDIKNKEDQRAFTDPARTNHVLTTNGYHFLEKELSRIGPDNRAHGMGIPFTSTHHVCSNESKALGYEVELVTALRKTVRENVSAGLKLCVLNEVGGGNGSHKDSVGAAGIAALVVKLDDFRFNADKTSQEHLQKLLRQVPGSESIGMNEKKHAMLNLYKDSKVARKAEKEEAAKEAAKAKARKGYASTATSTAKASAATSTTATSTAKASAAKASAATSTAATSTTKASAATSTAKAATSTAQKRSVLSPTSNNVKKQKTGEKKKTKQRTLFKCWK